jgi:hypothetical protein
MAFRGKKEFWIRGKIKRACRKAIKLFVISHTGILCDGIPSFDKNLLLGEGSIGKSFLYVNEKLTQKLGKFIDI